MNKIIYLILLLFLLVINNGCEDILSEDPASLATNKHYTSADGIIDGLNATYTPLRSFYGQQAGFFLTVTGVDIMTNGFGGVTNDPLGTINDYSDNFLPTYPFIETIWDEFYWGINQSNVVIESVPSVTNMSDQEKARVEGEARLLRAIYYYHLVRQFGPIHFTLESTVGVETEATRTPESTIYEEGIVPDLEFAVENLPESSDDYGRVIKPAAEALLANVHLTLENWPEAQQLSLKVINDYSFELVNSHEELWDINNDRNSEIVWPVVFTDDVLTQGPGNRGHLYFTWDYTFNPAMVRDVKNGRPWQRFMPTNHLFDLYDRENDARWNGSFETVWFANTESEINGHTVAPGDTAIKIVMYEVSDEDKSIAPYWLIDYKENWVGSVTGNLEIGSNQRRNHPRLKKYMDPLRRSTNAPEGQRDFPVIRLAEMYLIAAESAWRQGDNINAAKYINEIRRRGAIIGRESQMELSPNEITLDLILDERARELVGEKHRWYDLKRTNKLLERVRLYNLDASPNIQEFNRVRPIPQSHIDRVSNPGEFPQNEGY